MMDALPYEVAYKDEMRWEPVTRTIALEIMGKQFVDAEAALQFVDDNPDPVSLAFLVIRRREHAA